MTWHTALNIAALLPCYVAVVLVVRWARRVRLALQQIARNTTPPATYPRTFSVRGDVVLDAMRRHPAGRDL